ncbi:Uncharacterised protein [Vibrio cholerae]|nr:Uncharacterised protein [Vibrio cholerae]
MQSTADANRNWGAGRATNLLVANAAATPAQHQ